MKRSQIMLISLVTIFVSVTSPLKVHAQEADAENGVESEPKPTLSVELMRKSPFDNILSDAYTLKGGQFSLGLSYSNTSSTGAINYNFSKVTDLKLMASVMMTSVQVGFSTNTVLGLSMGGDLGSNTTYSYTPYGHSLGLVDTTYNTKGVKDPTIGVTQVVYENNNLKLNAGLSATIMTGNRIAAETSVTGNALNGGNAYAADVTVVKALNRWQLGAELNYNYFDTKTVDYNFTHDQKKVTGGNEMTASVLASFFLSEKFVIKVAGGRVRKDSATTSSVWTQVRSIEDTINSSVGGLLFGWAPVKNMSFTAGAVYSSSEPYNFVSNGSLFNISSINSLDWTLKGTLVF